MQIQIAYSDNMVEQTINASKFREIGGHCFCRLGIEEYVENGEKTVCLECETCGKTLIKLKLARTKSQG